ncbi:hypothetical protein [Acinetobacter larvae]|uniref:Uncharacterized protein n=1 Tax=Acinetobacter larvae TaxID=1789224 RepID=A0A1B2LVN8_9GAMM|nr:hypothetical protein [Acinetobacter larvae]AOA57011.1 hypothetical protein BFG52_00655 [Acinetobacter larvae]
MDTWKCNNCIGYIPIDYSKIKTGDLVFFILKKTYGNRGDKILKTGNIMEVLENKVLINSHGKIIENNLEDIYPFSAPAKIIYKIFGICCCCSRT